MDRALGKGNVQGKVSASRLITGKHLAGKDYTAKGHGGQREGSSWRKGGTLERRRWVIQPPLKFVLCGRGAPFGALFPVRTAVGVLSVLYLVCGWLPVCVEPSASEGPRKQFHQR